MPAAKIDLPDTLKRSPRKAQRTYRETLRHAYEEYDGDEAAAHRVAYASLQHSFEKVGDHWESKSGKAGATKRELMERAREEDIPGRSSMSKDELVRALGKAGRRKR